MKKVIGNLLFYIVWIVSIGVVYVFQTSIWTWISWNVLIKSIPFLLIGILILGVVFILLLCIKKHKVLTTILTILAVTSALITSVFYFPFVIGHSLSKFEMDLEQKYFLHDIQNNKKSNTWSGNKVVAHSMGIIDGNSYAPSLETFLESYKNGYRSMEVDFVYTSDHFLVCRHLWDNPDLQEGIDATHVPSLQTFKNTKILGEYTPLSFADLCKLLKEYPDVWIVTDTKDASVEEVRQHYSSMVIEAQENDCLEVLDRFVVQAYTTKMVETIREIYPFQNYIYASYMFWDGNVIDFIKMCRWCNHHGVDAISMWDIYYCPNIQYIADQYGIEVYVHTINSIQRGQDCLDMGAKGIYSDLVQPKDLK